MGERGAGESSQAPEPPPATGLLLALGSISVHASAIPPFSHTQEKLRDSKTVSHPSISTPQLHEILPNTQPLNNYYSNERKHLAHLKTNFRIIESCKKKKTQSSYCPISAGKGKLNMAHNSDSC